MLDLSTLDTVGPCDKGAELEIKHPITNVGTGIFIRVLGRDSSVFKSVSRGLSNAKMRRDALAQRRGKDAEIRTVEDIERENLELLAACTVGWRTGKREAVLLRGVELPCTPENAVKVYQEFPFIYDQVNEGIGLLENFIKA